LSVSDPRLRPPASAWVAALEAVLDTLGASAIMRGVWDTQGGGRPSPAPALDPVPARRDVVIRPVVASPRPVPKWTLVPPPPVAPWRRPAAVSAPFVTAGAPGGAAGTGGSAWQTPGSPAGAGTLGGSVGWQTTGPPVASSSAVSPQARAYVAQAAAWWVALHRATLHALWTPGHRGEGARHLAVCAGLDFVVALVALFAVAMIVAPVLGI
jgi:hypothetical protein